MVTRTSSTRRTPAFSATQSSVQPSPTISSIVVTDSNYTDLDDTAIGSTGGYIKIKGYGFTANSLVLFNGANVTNTYVSSTEYRAVIPATSVGTYNVMVFNNNIGAIYTGASVSGFPTWTITSYSNFALDVSVQLLATGDGTLTYTLYSGSLPSGLTLSANGLISGTVSSDVTSSFDVLVNDSQNQTTQQTITLTVSSTDTYWKNTCLFLNGEVTSNVSVYEDASNVNSAIAIVGDTRPAAKSPFASPQLSDGSAYFDGTGDYLSIADSAALRIGTSSFTIEGWFYATAISASQRGIIAKGPDAASTGWEIRIDGASGGQLASTFTSSVVKGTTVIATNTWYHFALVRNGTAVNLYLNGTSEVSSARSDDFSQTDNMYIGYTRQVSSAQPFLGYISNIRVTKQALYTSNFTPSTAALTTTSQGASAANVIFLGCQTNLSNENTKVVDVSRNDYTITRNTSPTVSTFSPYGNNWSVLFDGTGDYISSANTVACNMGSGNFTVEGWFYCTANNNPQRVINNWDTTTTSAASWEISLSADTTVSFSCSTAGVTNAFQLSSSVTPKTWNHFAAVRNGNVFTLYVNGNSTGSNTQSITLQAGNTVTIASRRNGATANVEPFFGYLSNIRVAKQAIYTANFTPSTTALTTTSQGVTAANVTLLTCKSNQIIDLSGSAASLTRANDAIVTKFSPFGGTSAYTSNTYIASNYFNGTTDYINVPNSTVLTLGTGDFTIEAWVFNTNSTIAAANNFIYDARGASTNAARPCIQLGIGAIGYSFFVNNADRITSGSSAVKLRQWQHIAVSRFSGNTKMFVDGVQAGSTFLDATNYIAGSTFIGAGNGATVAGWWPGYITDVRTTIGTALYTTTFTPNTTPLLASSNTKLLLNATNSGIIDGTMLNSINTSGNVVSTRGATKFGNRSIFFDGTGDYLTITNNSDNYNFGTGNLTFEMWVYPTTVTKAMTIVDTRSGTGSTTGMIPFEMSATGNVIVSIGGSQLFTSSTSLTANTWTHLAVVRAGTNVTLYINGTKPTTGNGTSAAAVTDNFLTIGTSIGNRDATTTNHFQGYIDDLRITKGYARYGGNFVVTSLPFPGL